MGRVPERWIDPAALRRWADRPLPAWPIWPNLLLLLRPDVSMHLPPAGTGSETTNLHVRDVLQPFLDCWENPYVHHRMPPERGRRTPTMERLLERLSQFNGTVVLNLEQLWPPAEAQARLRPLLRGLLPLVSHGSCMTNRTATAHIYISTPGHGGTEHHDVGHVAALQLTGRKRCAPTAHRTRDLHSLVPCCSSRWINSRPRVVRRPLAPTIDLPHAAQ